MTSGWLTKGWGRCTLFLALLIITVSSSASAQDAWYTDQPQISPDRAKARSIRAILIGYDASFYGNVSSPYIVVHAVDNGSKIERIYLSAAAIIDGRLFECDGQPSRVCKQLPSWLLLKLPIMVEMRVWDDRLVTLTEPILATDRITTLPTLPSLVGP